jgi:signal transduction histidine kinase
VNPDAIVDASQELTVLSFATRLLLADLERETLIERGLESLADFAKAPTAAIFFLDAGRGQLGAGGSLGCDGASGALPIAVSGSPFEEVFRSKQPRSFPLAFRGGLPCPVAESPADGSCLCVPLIEAHNRVIGVVTLEQPAAQLLDPVALQCLLIVQSVLAISLENARALADLKTLHAQLETLNLAKTKMIDHLSHELKTPLTILSASSQLLRKPGIRQKDERAASVLDRMQRSIDRLLDLEAEAGDIAKQKEFQEKCLLDGLLGRCRDLVDGLAEEREDLVSSGTALSRRIAEIYSTGGDQTEATILFHEWIPRAIASWQDSFRHRKVRLETDLGAVPAIVMPESPLSKAFRGLVRNAIENTPDGGEVRIELEERGGSVWLRVRDNGLGMDEELQRHLFHGFVHAGSTDDYSSGRPYDFRAGGQGLDLLRTKLFSERYGFRLTFESRPGAGSVFCLEFPASMVLTSPAETDTREGR